MMEKDAKFMWQDIAAWLAPQSCARWKKPDITIL